MSRSRRIVLAGLAAAALGAGGITGLATHGFAATEHTDRYQWSVGAGGLTPPEGPDITRNTANGHMLIVEGSGTFTKGNEDSVTGGGSFVVTDDAAHVLAQGTWTAKGLDSFTSFGTGNGFPEDLEGGLAEVDIAIHPAGSSATYSGTLWIHCMINNPGTVEGITSSVPVFHENFNLPVFGETVFVNQDSDSAPN